MLNQPRESDIQKTIMQYLTLRGWLVWRNNTGSYAGEHKGKKRFVRFGKKGSADVFCLLPEGRFLSVEVKRPGNKPTEAQLLWQQEVNTRGGLAVIVYSLDELIAALMENGY